MLIRISDMKRKSDNGFVFMVDFTYYIIDGNFAEYYDEIIIYGQTGENFIPFQNITEEIVLGWINTTISNDKRVAIENILLSKIEQSKNPPTISGLPW